DNVVETVIDLILGHPEDRRIQIHVLAARQLRMESRADLDETSNTPSREHAAGVGFHDARNKLESRRFSGAVEAHDGDRFALAYLKTEVIQCHEGIRPDLFAADPADEGLLEGVGIALEETLGDMIHDDARFAHRLLNNLRHQRSCANARS